MRSEGARVRRSERALARPDLAPSHPREPLPAEHPLLALSNVVLTPHIGWPTDLGYERFADAAADVLVAFLEGREVPLFDR